LSAGLRKQDRFCVVRVDAQQFSKQQLQFWACPLGSLCARYRHDDVEETIRSELQAAAAVVLGTLTIFNTRRGGWPESPLKSAANVFSTICVVTFPSSNT